MKRIIYIKRLVVVHGFGREVVGVFGEKRLLACVRGMRIPAVCHPPWHTQVGVWCAHPPDPPTLTNHAAQNR